MNIAAYNRQAWDQQVARGNQWTVPVSPEVIAAARCGDWRIVLTPARPVPAAWFPPLRGCRVLCLAGAGGQQAPVLAAAGAVVTVVDNSPKQLAQDRAVAEREGLAITTLEGDMRDLSALADASFDLVIHPISNCFVPDIRPVWREAHRVLRPGGCCLAGFIQPLAFAFGEALLGEDERTLSHRLPYSDLESLSPEKRQRLMDAGEPLVFSHSLDDQIGGQIEAGFAIIGLYEDTYPGKAFSEYLPACLATKAIKPGNAGDQDADSASGSAVGAGRSAT